MRRRRMMLLVSCLGLAAIAVIAWPSERQPRYQGRSLGSWLALYHQRSTGKLTVAEIDGCPQALQHIGTNALPWLLKWIHYQPPGKIAARLQKASDRIPWQLREHLGLVRGFDGTGRRAESAVEGFALLGSQAEPAIPELMRLLSEDSGGSQDSYYAGMALVRLGNHSLAPLLRALRDPGQTNRWSLAVVVGNICLNAKDNAETAVPILAECLKDEDVQLSRAAATALGDCTSVAGLAVPPLVSSLQDRRIREAAADALMDFGSEARPALPALIAGLNDPQFGPKAAETLGILAIEPALVVPALTGALQSTNREVRPAAARALGLLEAEARPAIPALIETLRDPRDPHAQAAAADVLGELQLEPELVIPALTGSLQSTNRWLRNLAGLSLQKFSSQPKTSAASLPKRE